MTMYGYSRVSSKQQENNYSLQNQKEELLKYGIKEENIKVEIASAALFKRPVLQQLLDQVKEGDRIVVTKYDRFARTMLESLEQLNKLKERGIYFEALDFNINTADKAHDFLTLVTAYFAETEQSIRKSRIREGIEKAKMQNKYKGRKSVITPKLLSTVAQYKEKQLRNKEIIALTGLSKSTLYKALKKLDCKA